MAVKTENTMAEGLQSIMTDITNCMLCADADLPFLAGLQGDILNYLKQGSEVGAPPGGGMGSPSPMGGMAPQQMQPQHQLPVNPAMSRQMLSNPSPAMGPQSADMGELRRMLS